MLKAFCMDIIVRKRKRKERNAYDLLYFNFYDKVIK